MTTCTIFSKEELLRIDTTEEILFSPNGKQYWEKLVESSRNDPAYMALINYIHMWATLMQTLIHLGAKVEDIASSTSYEAENALPISLSGYSESIAIQILIKTWAYGEELEKWYLPPYKRWFSKSLFAKLANARQSF